MNYVFNITELGLLLGNSSTTSGSCKLRGGTPRLFVMSLKFLFHTNFTTLNNHSSSLTISSISLLHRC